LHELATHLNLVIGGLGTTVYALWAGKWWRRGSKRLFLINALAAIGLAAFSVIYAIIIFDPAKAVDLGPQGLRYLVPLTIGAPIVARLIEYRRDQQREEYAKTVVDKLRGVIDDPA
jgi:hypothetical protein